MNQIIFSNDNNYNNHIESNSNSIIKQVNYNQIWFKILFVLSSMISIIFIIYFVYFNYNLNKKEQISQKLSDNFEVKTLYSTNESYSTNLDVNNYVVGIIEINSIGISYPIISVYSDENLKISPCKFCGPNPNEIGNLCIVAHNYNNYKFFSKINTLNNYDIISIYDLNRSKNRLLCL